nr:PREDICTED: RCC1 and BTB domain-containing protein 1-like isoform X2 [Linepithema humile]
MWYGKNDELVNWQTVLIVTKDKNVYCLDNEKIIKSHAINILEIKKVEDLCQKNIKTMICTNDCSFVLTEEGKIYSWGLNAFSMCGHEIDYIIPYPLRILEFAGQRVVDIRCGYFHVLVLTDDRKVYSWGENYCGQVGNTDVDLARKPMEVIIVDIFGKKKDIQSISCGSTFNMAVTCDGQLYGWGENTYGQLGLGDNAAMINRKPIKIIKDVAIAKVECGSEHTLALTREGLLYVWGKNDDGQLGIGSCVNHIVSPITINTGKIGKITDIVTRYDCTRSALVNENKRIYVWGSYVHKSKCYLSPIDINLNNIHDAFIDLRSFIKVHNPCTSLSRLKILNYIMSVTHLETVFDNSMSADVKLLAYQESIYIHKNVIMIKCPEMYKKLFMHNSDSVIIRNDFSAASYKSFLKYVYTGVIDLPYKNPLETYVLASSYGDKMFLKLCIRTLKQEITILNVMHFYAEAISLKIKKLEEFCFTYAINNLTVVVKTEGYAKLSEEIQFNFIIKAANACAFKY